MIDAQSKPAKAKLMGRIRSSFAPGQSSQVLSAANNNTTRSPQDLKKPTLPTNANQNNAKDNTSGQTSSTNQPSQNQTSRPVNQADKTSSTSQPGRTAKPTPVDAATHAQTNQINPSINNTQLKINQSAQSPQVSQSNKLSTKGQFPATQPLVSEPAQPSEAPKAQGSVSKNQPSGSSYS
ncbi:MAG: hypothetical protein GF390_02830, partial [Candidatus Pacebacteria bacterium]|nr:hypothetical protein [Candidatus Paceibacterota bacterium]